MEKIFEHISEIEEELRKKFPPILYKYRDWDCIWHQSILTKKEVWLSHPKTLNDDLDIRIPYKFNYEEISSDFFFEKLKGYAICDNWFPNLIPDSRDFLAACENKLEEIKENPIKYFNKTYEYVYNSDSFDVIGVLSLTDNPLSRTMWAHYGNNSKGFCIGFNTIELFRNIMPIDFGKVDYVHEAMNWSFLNAERKNLTEWFYKKHVDWSNEREYRFITSNIGEDKRQRNFQTATAKEIIVGTNISADNLKNIIEKLKEEFNSKVDLYKIVRDTSSYRIGKQKISY